MRLLLSAAFLCAVVALPVIAADPPKHPGYRVLAQDRNHVAIVGTELRSIERVTGRLTRSKVAAAGALSGLWMGLFVGIAFAIFSKDGQLGFLITTPFLGAIFGLALSQFGFSAATRNGHRDFSSVSQVIATKYEVLVEHNVAERARELLVQLPPR